MGSDSGWEPIKLYESVAGSDEASLSREQIKQKLDAAKPDEVRRAGQAFIDAADLVGGAVGGNGPSETGLQAALSRTAKDLAEVWRGPAAAQVQSALRALYATAGALGDAMTASGAAMSWYADLVREAQANFPAGRGDGNQGGAGASPSPTPTPYPSASPSPTSTPTPSPSAGPSPSLVSEPDEAARKHFRALNQKIQEANNAFAEGLAFELPAIEPLDIDLASSPRIRVDGTGVPSTRSDGVWQGGSGSAGADGSNGSGSTGSTGSDGSGSSGTGGSGGSDSDGSGPIGSGGPGGPGTATPTPDPGGAAGQPGGSGDEPGTAPPVIGGNTGTTDLAHYQPATGALPGGANPAATTPTVLTTTPDLRTPVTTIGPSSTLPPGGVIGTHGGAGPRTGYGAGGAEGGAFPSGHRTGQSGTGSSFFPYAPMAGGGTGGAEEREREIYDPEPDLWRVTSTVSPDRIG